MMSEIDELKKQCVGLMRAFHSNACLPEDDPRRNNPLTPNDPATISTLASHLLGYLRTAARISELEGRVEELVKIAEAARQVDKFFVWLDTIVPPNMGTAPRDALLKLKAELAKHPKKEETDES